MEAASVGTEGDVGLRANETSPLRASWPIVAKGFAIFFIPLAVLMGGVFVLLYHIQTDARQALLKAEERSQVALLRKTIIAELHPVVADLTFLSEDRAMRELLDGGGSAETKALAEQFRVFADHKRLYGQLRLLDDVGREVIRVNLVNDRAIIVPEDQLQVKSGRYYFESSDLLNRGEVFASRFDLNVEQGVVEQPPKPTVRFSTPVFDSQATKRGLVIINYSGKHLVKNLKKESINAAGEIVLLNESGQLIMLLNESGHRLLSTIAEGKPKASGADLRGQNFGQTFPEEWQNIAQSESGQFISNPGMITFETVCPVPEAERRGSGAADLPPRSGRGGSPDVEEDDCWKIVSHVPSNVLSAQSREVLLGLRRIYSIFIVGLSIGSWLLAGFRADRELTSQALRESESRFRQMADNIDEVFWMVTPNRRHVIYVSPAYEQMFGRSCASLYEQSAQWLDAIHHEDRERVEEAMSQKDGAGDFDVQYRIVRSDGTVRWIWDRGFAIRNNHGTVQRVAGIAQDTTAIKQAQEQLLQSERLAAIGQAMAGLVHESRNALQRSQACLELLAMEVEDNPEAVGLVDRIGVAQNDLHRLYEEVRGYAAPIHLDRETCDLAQLLSDAWSYLEAMRNGKDIGFRQFTDQVTLDCEVDPFALGQVFRNILENAISVCPEPGQITVHCMEAKLEGQAAIEIAIRDNGPGIPPQEAEKVFEPFYTTKTKGTGLGMAIAKRIVEAHGGWIRVGAGADTGAEFLMTLPRGGV